MAQAPFDRCCPNRQRAEILPVSPGGTALFPCASGGAARPNRGRNTHIFGADALQSFRRLVCGTLHLQLYTSLYSAECLLHAFRRMPAVSAGTTLGRLSSSARPAVHNASLHDPQSLTGPMLGQASTRGAARPI